MSRSFQKVAPALSYANVLLTTVLAFIALLILTGGFELYILGWNLGACPLSSLAAILVATLAWRRLLLRREGGGKKGKKKNDRLKRWSCAVPLVLFMLAYLLFVGSAALARHSHFASESFDLGLFEQVLWNTHHGNFLHTTLGGGLNYLGIHFSPILALAAQGYRFLPVTDFLTILQTLFLALGAWPVYLMGVRKLESPRWGLILAALYLSYPPLRQLNLMDFHPVAMAITPLLFALYFFDEDRRLPGYAALALALLCKEEVLLVACFLGLYIAFARRRYREGLFLSVLSLNGFAVVTQYAMPALRGGAPPGIEGSPLGSSFSGALTALLFQDGAVDFAFTARSFLPVLELFLPLALLPLAGLPQLLAGVPVLAGTLLLSLPPGSEQFSFHSALFIPFVFAALAAGLENVRRLSGRLHRGIFEGPWVKWLLLLAALSFFGPSPARFFDSPRSSLYTEEFRRASELIGSDASLSVQGNLASYFGRRREIFLFPQPDAADYVFVESPEGREGRGIPEGYYGQILEKVRSQGYRIVHYERYFILLARDGGQSEAKDLRRIELLAGEARQKGPIPAGISPPGP